MNTINIEDIKAKDIMNVNYEKIDVSASIASVLKYFKKKEVCFAFDKDKYKGMVTERSIVRSQFDPKHHNISSILVHTPVIDTEDNVYDIAQKMIEAKMRFLPVMNNGKIQGGISDELFLDKLKNTDHAKEHLGSIMTENLISTEEKTPISRVLNLMRENNISRVLIDDEEGRHIGIVALHDIITKVICSSNRISKGEIVDEKKHPLSAHIFEIGNYDLITLKTTDELRKTADLFIKNKISSVLIRDDEDKIVGIVTITDVFESIMKNRPAPKSIKYVISLSGIKPDEINKEMLEKKLSGLMTRLGHYIGMGSTLFIYAKEHSKTNNHVRMRLVSKKGVFISTNKNHGFEYDFSKATDQLEVVIEKKKEKYSQ